MVPSVSAPPAGPVGAGGQAAPAGTPGRWPAWAGSLGARDEPRLRAGAVQASGVPGGARLPGRRWAAAPCRAPGSTLATAIAAGEGAGDAGRAGPACPVLPNMQTAQAACTSGSSTPRPSFRSRNGTEVPGRHRPAAARAAMTCIAVTLAGRASCVAQTTSSRSRTSRCCNCNRRSAGADAGGIRQALDGRSEDMRRV